MFLLLTVCCFLSGSAAVKYEEVCYGSTYKFPFDYSPPAFMGKIFFTPSQIRGTKKLVMDNGKAVDPRYKVTQMSASLPDLTDRDDGTFSTSYSVIRLKIVDCSEAIQKTYGQNLFYDVPRQAEFLPPLRLDEPKILWDRTSTQSRKRNRRRVTFNSNFRNKDNTLLSRIKPKASATTEVFDLVEDQSLTITLPLESTLCTVIYIRESNPFPVVVMIAGHLVEDGPFLGRISKVGSDQIKIISLTTTDSGRFNVSDLGGKLVLVVELNVVVAPPHMPLAALAFIPFIIMFFVASFCFCCVKKCCCKNHSMTRESAPLLAAPPPMQYHEAYQNPGPRYVPPPCAPAYPYRPLYPTITKEPMSGSAALPLGGAFIPARIHVSSHQPQVAASQLQQTAPVVPDFLSMDSEMKRLTFPGALPLGSDSTYCNGYTADKVNFL